MRDRAIVLVGNCQVIPIADCLRLMLPTQDVLAVDWGRFSRQNLELSVILRKGRYIFSQMKMVAAIEAKARSVRWDGAIYRIPTLFFTGLHPDAVHAFCRGSQVAGGVTGSITSAIALFAWIKGLSVSKAVSLFTPEIFESIGYLDHWADGLDLMRRSARTTEIPIDDFLDRWVSLNPFMHIINHPKIFVLADIARRIASILGLEPRVHNPEEVVEDRLKDILAWPLYPGIAENLGLTGNFVFKVGSQARKSGDARTSLGLEEYVEDCFELYSRFPEKEQITCTRFDSVRFRVLDAIIDGSHVLPRKPS